ncbi:kelch-like protein 10, partial [Tachysurus ichikawai]
MKYYKRNGRDWDIIISVEGTHFQAHRIVLQELSPYFSALFTRWSSPNQIVYTIPGVAPHIMDYIIQYAYTKWVRITRKNVKDLAVAADYLLVNDVVRLCCKFLEKQLSPLNCVEIRRFARAHCWSLLFDKASVLAVKSVPGCIDDFVHREYFQTHTTLAGVAYRTRGRCQKPYTRPHCEKQ